MLLCGSEIIFPDLGLLTLCVDILTGTALALARFGLGASALFGCLLIVHSVCALFAGRPPRTGKPEVPRFTSDHRNRIPASIQFVRSLREVPGADLIGVN